MTTPVNSSVFVVVDLEADELNSDSQTIEIGAVAQHLGDEPLAELRAFCRTTWGQPSSWILDLCKYDTSEAAALRTAPSFPQAIADFNRWTRAFPGAIFGSWGDYDARQLIRDCVATIWRSPPSCSNESTSRPSMPPTTRSGPVA